jgi:acyl-CoA oxidase
MAHDSAGWRIQVLSKHLPQLATPALPLQASNCLAYEPPEANSEEPAFDKSEMRQLLDGHDLELRDGLFSLMASSDLFVSRRVGYTVFASPDFNEPMGAMRDKVGERILFLLRHDVFKNFLTDQSVASYLRRNAVFETLNIFDHGLAVKLGVHYNLWGDALVKMGTKRHHDKWLQLTDEFKVRGCFAMTELGHGSNVRGIETVTTYDASTEEFIINTPCESAQKYWIGGAAKHATHAIVFSQLVMNGKNEGAHAFVCQIRGADGTSSYPGIRIADCGHKTGLNGVDNGRIWFDNVRIPRENLLNAVADVTPAGEYLSSIKNPDQRFGVFMAPLSSGRVTIAVSAINQAKVGLATALRYALARRAFTYFSDQPEVLLLDYPSHQHRLLPLLAKTYAMNFAALDLKNLCFTKHPVDLKAMHVISSGFKAMFSWHSMRTLQECREACGGQGLKTENRIGQLIAEHDVQSTFEGDNNVLMQQVSKALLAEYIAARKNGKPIKGMGLEHLNHPRPVLPHGRLTSLALRDPTFQLLLFRLRERGLLELLDARVKHLLSQRLSTTRALMSSYQLAEELGKAFTERTVLESILSAEQQATSGSVKRVLGLLRTLSVLSQVDEEPVFLRHGFLSAEQAQVIHGEVAAICGELRPQTLHLVDAFGIPQPFLGPIAFDWVKSNSWDHVNKS